MVASVATGIDLIVRSKSPASAVSHPSDESNNAEKSSQPDTARYIGTRESRDANLGYTQSKLGASIEPKVL